MCGISGILSCNNAKPPSTETIRRMTSTLMHRGPDGWGVYVSHLAALGHTRLSIIDLDGGHQPMVSDRYAIAYNGEVYNYIEIRKELQSQGIAFRTNSDTEVILKAFDRYGQDLFSKLNGQFAILIWDKIDKKLFAVRDRYGIRPLYVLEHKNSFYFSSELKAFDTIPSFNRKFEANNLTERALFWNTLGDHTVFKNIRSIPAGCYEIFSTNNEYKRQRYYDIGETRQNQIASIPDAMEEFKHLFEDAVRLRLRSDVPVGTYLSGGIDSSVVSYLTSQQMREKLKTFSIGFNDPVYDESIYQNEMAAIIGTEHHRLDIDYEDINENFIHAAYHFEQPVFRTAEVPLYMLSKSVRSHGIKVVLTGEGADEILCGYDSFKEAKLLQFWHKQPHSKIRPLLIKRLYPHLVHYQSPKQYGLMRMYYEGFLNDSMNDLGCLNIRIHNNSIIKKYLSEEYARPIDKNRLCVQMRDHLPADYSQWSVLQRNQYLEMKTLLEGYLLSAQGDRMSLAHGVEGRYPFLDHRVVERSFFLHDKLKLNGFKEKYLLKQCYKKIIPESIIRRPKKPYTSPDLKSFLYSGKLSDMASDMLSSERINDYGIFDPKTVERLVRKVQRHPDNEKGYRDNMLITFILSSQLISYWIKNPKRNQLNEKLKNVDIDDNPKGVQCAAM